MIVCPRCSKENQDHYKFCLGCGSELPRGAVQAPKDFRTPTPPAEYPVADAPAGSAEGQPVGLATTQVDKESASGQAPVEQPQPSVRPSGPTEAAPDEGFVACPSCGKPVPPDFKFCGTCGHSLVTSSGDVPTPEAAPDPAPAAAPAPAEQPDTLAATEPVVAATQPAPSATLVLINPDGSDGPGFALGLERTSVGRDIGGAFGGDLYLSPVHAEFFFKDDQLHVLDKGSLNGVYVRLDRNAPTAMEDGAVFRIGQEILRFEAISQPEAKDGIEEFGGPNPGYLGRVCTVTGRETIGEAFAIPPDGMHMGRERGDITFPEDGYVSGLHCRIHKEGDQVMITDVGSSNGTYLRVQGERPLRSGELVLMGQQLFSARY